MEEKSTVSLQKFKWKKHKVFKDYESASNEKESLLKDNKNIKIRRCGEGGTLFKVLIGSPVSSNPKKINKKGKGKNK